MSTFAILTDQQRALLVAVLNRIIPADDTFPGAGDLGIAEPLEKLLAEQPAARRLFLDGLAAIEITSWRRVDAAFSELSTEQRDEVLSDVERSSPVFFDQLVSHTYRHYYVNARVVQLLGFSAEPPQPAGHTLPPFNPMLLDQVRARGPVYRKT